MTAPTLPRSERRLGVRDEGLGSLVWGNAAIELLYKLIMPGTGDSLSCESGCGS